MFGNGLMFLSQTLEIVRLSLLSVSHRDLEEIRQWLAMQTKLWSS